jgi:hypothetical protein
LDSLYREMLDDSIFHKQELNRFEALLQTAGKQYGGGKYEDVSHVMQLLSFSCLFRHSC